MTTNYAQAITTTRTHAERVERRQKTVSIFSRQRLNGRRRTARRIDDDRASGRYVDQYSRRTAISSLIILVLCVADAFMTLNLLNHGATEINLVMRLAIEEGVAAFIISKYLMTAVSVIFLVVHSHFRISRSWQVHHIISGFALVYVVLLIYEVAIWRSMS